MHFVVCIKQVPEKNDVKINPETNTLMREGVESIINPFDMYAIEEGLRLEASGWKGREGTAILQDSGEAEFYRGLTARLDGTGRVRQYALRLGDSLVAWDLCLIHESVCYALKTTYDESTGEVMCLVEVPATYRTVEKRILVSKQDLKGSHRRIGWRKQIGNWDCAQEPLAR